MISSEKLYHRSGIISNYFTVSPSTLQFMHNSISISAHLFFILNQIIPNKEQITKKHPTLLTVKIKSQKLSRNQTQTLNWHDKNRALVVFNDVILKVFLLKGSFKQCKFYANIFFSKQLSCFFERCTSIHLKNQGYVS